MPDRHSPPTDSWGTGAPRMRRADRHTAQPPPTDLTSRCVALHRRQLTDGPASTRSPARAAVAGPGSCPRKGLLAPLGRWLGSCPRARGTPQSHGGPITLHPRQARGNSRQGHVSGTSEPMRHTPVRTAVGRLAAISCAGTLSPTGCGRSCRRTTRRRSLPTRRCVCMEWFVDGVHSQPTRAGRRARTSRIASASPRESPARAGSRSVYRDNHAPRELLRHGDVRVWSTPLTPSTSRPPWKPRRWRDVWIQRRDGGSAVHESGSHAHAVGIPF